MNNLLTAQALTKVYREGAAETTVVDHVDLEVREGEFLVLMGASGSGKTSLLHLLAGLDCCDSGKITYTRAGQRLELQRMNPGETAKFRRESIGVVFQQQCLIPDLTAYENILLPLMLGNVNRSGDSRREAVLDLCGRFGLKEHVGKYPAQLSGGQQQRAAILRAVVHKPPLLLCDEPTGSLNSAQSEQVMDLLSRLNVSGQTILLVTHDMKVALRGSRVLYIEDGRVAGELELDRACRSSAREEALRAFLQEKGW